MQRCPALEIRSSPHWATAAEKVGSIPLLSIWRTVLDAARSAAVFSRWKVIATEKSRSGRIALPRPEPVSASRRPVCGTGALGSTARVAEAVFITRPVIARNQSRLVAQDMRPEAVYWSLDSCDAGDYYADRITSIFSGAAYGSAEANLGALKMIGADIAGRCLKHEAKVLNRVIDWA